MRIVAGSAKGRKIESPKGRDVRPTGDRVREALFSSIAFRLRDARVLDLFAGTGALGLEAVSRGAASSVFVDRSKRSVEIIRRNIAACGFGPRCEVFPRDALLAIPHFKTSNQRFDLVFLDPPYAGEMLEKALAALVDAAVLSDDVLISAEHPADRPPKLPAGLAIASSKRYGKTVLSFVQRTLYLELAEQ